MADNSSGRLGEQYAAERMKNDGYEIICTNYRSRFGEIDIIASDSKYIVFVEVKTRRYTSYARPVEWVTKTKQNRIINTALMYLSEHKTNLNIRFDAVSYTHLDVYKRQVLAI